MNSKINLDIELDVNKIPTKIEWSAPDGGVKKSKADAFILSVWDGETKDTKDATVASGRYGCERQALSGLGRHGAGRIPNTNPRSLPISSATGR